MLASLGFRKIINHLSLLLLRIISTVTNDLTYDQRMIRICTSLADMGHEVLLVGRKLPQSLPLEERAFRQKRLTCFFRKGKLFYLEYNLRLLLFLLPQKVDIINSVDLDTLLPGMLTARFRGKKLVYDAHEYFTETPEVERRPAVQRIWEWVALFCIPRTDGAYTVGPALAETLSRRYGVPFGYIRNLPYRRDAADTKNASSKTDSPPYLILYQGALNEGRGLEALIEAMKQLEGAELWFAGEGDLSSRLREQVDETGMQDKVKFLGFVRPEKLREITPMATLGLNLLEKRGLSYYYSLANKAFDYLQAEVPALHMAFPEYQALHQQYGGVILLDNLSPTLIAETLQSLLDDPARRRQLSRECRAAAPQLIWEKEASKLNRFYPNPS